MFLIRYGEIGLKGKNRNYFEKKLASNIEEMLKAFPNIKVERSRGRILVHADAENQDIRGALSRVFGISAVHPVEKTDKDLASIQETALAVMQKVKKHDGITTFKVEARRADKTFPLNSLELNVALGDYLLTHLTDLKVDVHHPDVTLSVEIREEAYVYGEVIKGQGGLPLGTSGKAVLLLSGGIDSPVAGFMAMRRGINIYPVYFHTPPFTGDLAKEKVVELTKALGKYCPVFKLTVVHFTEVQQAIMEYCKEELGTIIMRRMMMRMAEKIADQFEAKALITGENMGQVASQTMDAIYCTNAVCTRPVFRPLIGFDKMDIVKIAKSIGTYDISILPYEDCCAMFVPAKPKTRPKLEDCIKTEASVDWEALFEDALAKSEVIDIISNR